MVLNMIKNNNFTFLLLAVLAFAPAGLLYSTPVKAAEEKAIIGVIDLRAAIFSSKEAEQENKKLQREVDREKQKLENLKSKISSSNDKLKKNSDVMSDKQKQKLLTKLQEDLAEYQKLGSSLQQKITAKEKEFIEKQTEKIKPIVEKISKDRGLHAIMRIDTVIYGRLTVDITGEVIAALNKKKS